MQKQQLIFDYTTLSRFTRAKTKEIVLKHLLKKYNKVLEANDFYLILGFIDALKGEVRGTIYNDDENYKLISELCKDDVVKLVKEYQQRGYKKWQEHTEKSRPTAGTAGL